MINFRILTLISLLVSLNALQNGAEKVCQGNRWVLHENEVWLLA